MQNTELALKLASRGGLPGADDLYVGRFNQLFSTGAFTEAAKVAANSPRVCYFLLRLFKRERKTERQRKRKLTLYMKIGYSSYCRNY